MMMQDLFDIQLTEGALAVFARLTRVVVIVIAAFAASKILRRVIDGMAAVDKIKKAPAGRQSGMVDEPDKMIRIRVQADIK